MRCSDKVTNHLLVLIWLQLFELLYEHVDEAMPPLEL